MMIRDFFGDRFYDSKTKQFEQIDLGNMIKFTYYRKIKAGDYVTVS